MKKKQQVVEVRKKNRKTPPKEKTPSQNGLEKTEPTVVLESQGNVNQLEQDTDKLQTQISGDAEEQTTKRKYTRRSPTKSAEEERQSVVAAAKGLCIVILYIVGLIISRLPNPKPITETETAMLNQITEDVLVKYVASYGRFKEEIAFVGGYAAVIVRRIKKPSQRDMTFLEQEEKKEAA